MSQSENHHHHEISGKGLVWSIVLNIFITLAEAIGGIFTGSMALISDAAHNFSDVLSLIISLIANGLTKKSATLKQTYGYKRSEIIAAFINSATLIVLAVFILTEAIPRFFKPVTISADWVIYLSLLGILVNGLSALFIRKDADKSINIKSSYLHLFSDMLTSIAVLIGGLSMKYLQWYWVDTVFSVAISFYLIYMSWSIFSTSLRILMQFTPSGLSIQEIVEKVEVLEDIKNVHHVHVWQINEHDIMFEAHVDVSRNMTIDEFELVNEKISIILKQFDIQHVTIQPEFTTDDNKQIIHLS